MREYSSMNFDQNELLDRRPPACTGCRARSDAHSARARLAVAGVLPRDSGVPDNRTGWLGWRLFMIGLAATLLILLGYYGIHSHYFLYMGCVSGGALMAGGLWLRRL